MPSLSRSIRKNEDQKRNHFFNRELSEIDFFWRVLYQASDQRTPLLERVRFLAITARNLDEFIQKRVGGLKRQEAAGVTKLSLDGRSHTEQLELLRQAILELEVMSLELWEKSIRPSLASRLQIEIKSINELNHEDLGTLEDYFVKALFPILTPLAADAGRPFPFISNLSLSLAISVESDSQTPAFVRIKVPEAAGRWLKIKEHCYIAIEDVIAHFAYLLFPGMHLRSVSTFRITRNANFERDEEEAEDLLNVIEESLRERRFADIVRLELASNTPEPIKTFLLKNLAVKPEDVIMKPGCLAFRDLSFFANLAFPSKRFSHWIPVIPKRLKRSEQSMFDILRHKDLLVHHPYERFDSSVVRLLMEAASDPRVLAIKQTLYRTGTESSTVNALIKAAEQGKQVMVVVEIKARFDEANNIEWGKKLESVGVHVVYGIVGLKTHSKTLLIIREEEAGIRTYCHVGTGNYHSGTSILYTDFGLMTADQRIGFDLTLLFHRLSGYAPKQSYKHLLVAPEHMRAQFLELINQEIQQQLTYNSGRIVAKMNGLDDELIITKLYEASQQGVKINLIVRGVCTLRPGLRGLSENITVRSLVGRFLEHERVFYFANNGAAKVYIGSADWRWRNLSDRVEVATPIYDIQIKESLIDYLEQCLKDNRLSWELSADGNYTQNQPKEISFNLHNQLMKGAKKS